MSEVQKMEIYRKIQKATISNQSIFGQKLYQLEIYLLKSTYTEAIKNANLNEAFQKELNLSAYNANLDVIYPFEGVKILIQNGYFKSKQ